MKNWIRWGTVLGLAGAVAIGVGLSASAAPIHTSAPRAVSAPVVSAPVLGGQVFVPINPCRIANTHFSTPKFIEVNGVRDFYVRGAGAGFAAQGGTPGGCNIPDDALSIVTTVNATASQVFGYLSGYLQGYPTGTAPGTANFLAFKTGGTSGNPTLTLADFGEPSLSIKSLGGRTEVAIDVTGYYAPLISIDGVVNGTTGTVLPGSNGLVSVTRNGTGDYTVNVASDVTGCTPLVSAAAAGLQVATASISGAQAVQVNLNSIVGGLPADGIFTLNLLCR